MFPSPDEPVSLKDPQGVLPDTGVQEGRPRTGLKDGCSLWGQPTPVVHRLKGSALGARGPKVGGRGRKTPISHFSCFVGSVLLNLGRRWESPGIPGLLDLATKNTRLPLVWHFKYITNISMPHAIVHTWTKNVICFSEIQS